MQLPRARYKEQKSKKFIINFKGYNNNPVVDEGEFSSMRNLSSSFSPCLSPRVSRSVTQTFSSPTNLLAKNQLASVDGTLFIYNGLVKGAVTAGEKCLVSMGDLILIFPDKKYYDVVGNVFGSLENSYVSGGSQITFSGNSITTIGADFTGFKVGDGVTISGCGSLPANNKTVIIRAVTAKVLTFSDLTFTPGVEAAAVSVKRAIPDIALAAEKDNRCWGVKGNDIFCSKLGDPTNWNVFDGLVTDSYATSVGTDGEFTAAINYAGHVLLIKEDHIHKVFGNRPSNFQVMGSAATGVQKGCSKSVSIVNEILYYKGRPGIMAYGGGEPRLVSEKFGPINYSKAVAGTDGRKYYVSLQNASTWTLFVYDTWRNQWDIEDNFQAVEFAFLDGYLYAINAVDKNMYKFNSGNETVTWEAVLGEMDEVINEKKGYSKLQLRAELEPGSILSVYLKLDSGDFQLLKTFDTPEKRSIYIPLQPVRADNFQIKLEGVGPCKIYSLVREFFYGSEV